MAWIYLADTVESHSDLVNGSDQSLIVKTSDTLKEFFYQGWQRENCPLLPFGTMSPRSTEAYLESKLISYTEASPAKISVLQELETAWRESEADYSLKCVDWSKKSSPLLSSWKTCQPLELEVFEKSSENLQIWGMTVDGLVYLPQKLEPTTEGKGGSYWHTPRATMINEPYEQYLKRMQRSKNPNVNTKTRPGNLAMQVNTPKFWPTPMARDYKDTPRQKHRGKRDYSKLPMEVYRKEVPPIPGKLNPTWVEWLMGVPLGWTELKPWAMEWFRSKSKQRLKNC